MVPAAFLLLAAALPPENLAVPLVHANGQPYCASVKLSDDLLLTASHCVSGADMVEAQCGAQRVPLKTIKDNPDLDLAVLSFEIPCNGVPSVLLRNGNPPVGTDVLATGCPGGYCGRYTRGVVSGYQVVDSKTDDVHHTVLVSDTQIWFGSSGGPLIEVETGKLVGIASQIQQLGTESEETFHTYWSWFIPVQTIRHFLMGMRDEGD